MYILPLLMALSAASEAPPRRARSNLDILCCQHDDFAVAPNDDRESVSLVASQGAMDTLPRSGNQ